MKLVKRTAILPVADETKQAIVADPAKRRWIQFKELVYPHGRVLGVVSAEFAHMSSLAYLYLRYTNPVYNAVASIIVKDEKKGAELMDNSMMKEIGLGGNNKLVENEIEILKSYDLMEAVVNNLQLFVSVYHEGRIRDVDVFADDMPFRFYIENPDAIQDTRRWKVTDMPNGVLFEADENKPAHFINYGQTVSSDGIRFRLRQDTLYSVPRSNEYYVSVATPSQTAVDYGRKLSVDAASISEVEETRIAVPIYESYEVKHLKKKPGV